MIVVTAVAAPAAEPTSVPARTEARRIPPPDSGAEVDLEWKALREALDEHKLTPSDLVALDSGAGNLEEEVKTKRTRELVSRMRILRQGLTDLVIDEPFLRAKIERTREKLTAGGGALSPEARARFDEIGLLMDQENYLKANEILTGLQGPR